MGGLPNSRSSKLKTAIALVAVLLLAACAAMNGQPAGGPGVQIRYDGGNLVDSQGAPVTTKKY